MGVKRSAEEDLEHDVASFADDPLGFVHFAYDWGHGELEDVSGPRNWQADILGELTRRLKDPKTKHQPILIAVASGHGIGKALCEETIIPTPKGDMRLKDIRVGDFVFGSNGKPTKVIARKENGLRPTYKVTFDDGSFTLADENHDWAVRGRQERRKRLDGWRVLSTKEILKLGVKRPNGKSKTCQWEIPTARPVHGVVSNSWAYAIGVWLGDGSRNRSSYTKPDLEVVEKLRECGLIVNKNHGMSWYIKKLGSELRRLHLFDCNSFERFIPDEVWMWDENSRTELLRGLLDTDGECNPKGSIIFSSSSENLLIGVIRLARSLGFKASRQATKEAYLNGTRHRDCHRATLTIPFGVTPFSIQRKAERVKEIQPRYLKRWITSIERVEDSKTICIEVNASDHLFLANDYIVTHNSALIGQIINWGLSTAEDTKIVVTANTDTQLRTKTQPEVGKWFRLSINSHWFNVFSTAIFTTDKLHERTWRADFVPWSKSNTEAFAGLHNKKKRIILIFDEASAIDDKVWEVAEGALTDEDTEIIWIAFGNPTRNTGRFRECFRKFKHRWITRQIDSRDVEGTNKEQFQKWVDDYGVDSDFVKVRVRGMFPSMSAKQFISVDDADLAFGRHLRIDQYDFAPKIIAVEPAWEGDDELVIALRQGLMFKILRTIPKNDNDIQIGNMVAHLEDEEKADAVFIDAGYGTGIVSAGRTMGRNWTLVWFGEKPNDKGYLNKRAEMWGLMKTWIKEGGAIPKDQVLYNDLIGPETVARFDGKIQLEAKDDMKARGIPSPNRADALALTFAHPVKKKSAFGNTPGRAVTEFDPFR